MIHVLIIGFGKIGKIHAKYLDDLKLKWSWYDPYNNKKCDKKVEDIKNLNKYTHIIISSPTNTHDEILKDIVTRYNNKILVEKPGITSLDNLHLLNNNKIYVGLVERFNPTIETLKNHIQKEKVLNIDFMRCSASPVSRVKENSFVDVAIHDLDLFYHIFDNVSIEDIKQHKNNNTFCVNIAFNNNKISRFIWSNETFYKERKIQVRQTNCNFICDLNEQVVKKYSIDKTSNRNTIESLYVEKKSPILSELQSFLFDNKIENYTNSHKLFIDLLENKNFSDSIV